MVTYRVGQTFYNKGGDYTPAIAYGEPVQVMSINPRYRYAVVESVVSGNRGRLYS